MNTTQQNAINEADNYAQCAGLPTYTDLVRVIADLNATKHHDQASQARQDAQTKAYSVLARLPVEVRV